jgi:hypothetical protein
MGTEYHHNYAKFRENCLNADFMVAEMLVRGEKVLARAEETAPYFADDPDHVHYRDNFVLTAGKHGGAENDRAYAKVSNHDMPTALFVEFGTSTMERYRTLGNALDGASGFIHGRTYRAITKGTEFEPPKPKPRKPTKPKETP